MNELFSEMDRLSKAWENADKQAEAQVVSLDKWEEEKEKLLLAVRLIFSWCQRHGHGGWNEIETKIW